MKNFIKSVLFVVVFTNIMVIAATALEVLCEHVDWIDKVMHFKVYTLEIGHAGSHLTIGAIVMVYITALIYGLLMKLWNKLVNKITNR